MKVLPAKPEDLRFILWSHTVEEKNQLLVSCPLTSTGHMCYMHACMYTHKHTCTHERKEFTV